MNGLPPPRELERKRVPDKLLYESVRLDSLFFAGYDPPLRETNLQVRKRETAGDCATSEQLGALTREYWDELGRLGGTPIDGRHVGALARCGRTLDITTGREYFHLNENLPCLPAGRCTEHKGLPTLRTPVYPRDGLDRCYGNLVCGACWRRNLRNQKQMNG